MSPAVCGVYSGKMNPAVRGALIGALVFACARSAAPDSSKPGPRVVRFSWIPSGAAATAYEIDDPEDQHRLVMVGNVTPGGEYWSWWRSTDSRAVENRRTTTHSAKRSSRSPAPSSSRGEVRPFILALPVFRYQGTNWPSFDFSRRSATR